VNGPENAGGSNGGGRPAPDRPRGGEPEAGLPERMFESPNEWLRPGGAEGDVVLSSRARLARNLAGQLFVHKAAPADLRLVLEACRDVLVGAGLGRRTAWAELHDAPAADRSLLVERHLISGQFAKGKLAEQRRSADWPRAVVVGLPDERASAMVNEEDHIRLQVIRAGLALEDAWREADAIDDRIEAGLDYAFSPRLGYLTACPTNVGTGVRFSVMLHLPGLRMAGELEKVKQAANDMSLAVRGFYGEGSEAFGDFYQLSNQTTLGKSEEQLLAELSERILPEVIDYERQSRQKLVDKRRWQIEDTVHRALGVLRHARLLGVDETMKLLSVVRLGVCTGLLEGVETEPLHRLMLAVQPTHLQRMLGDSLDQNARKRARAEVVRERLGGA
jgi:protein arginine kinase